MSHLGNTFYSQAFQSAKSGYFPSKTTKLFYWTKSPSKKYMHQKIQLKKEVIELTHAKEECNNKLSKISALV